MARGTRLNWRAEQVVQTVLENTGKALGEFGLVAEGEAKRELRKGHGVLTGTARRSIHLAEPGYNWGQDDVEPSEGGVERGKQLVQALIKSGKATIQLGSGLKYALPLHQGHHGFNGYHFLTLGVERAKTQLPRILKKYGLKK